MRILLFVLTASVFFVTSARAADPPVVTDDPALYAQTFADSMALSGVSPIRDVFEVLVGDPLPPDVEPGLLVYERAITQLPARVSRIIEDVTLGGDGTRMIYLYHYFGDTTWIFTRLEFVFVGDGRWALSRVAFADRWASVVVATTPGFQPSQSPADAARSRRR